MSSRFYVFWLVTAGIAFVVVVLGLALLSQMALTTTGYVPPVPWPSVLGAGIAVVGYWSALCWTVALIRRKPLIALAVAASAGVIAFAYPAWDQARYRAQQQEVLAANLIGIPPDWTGKTALLIWPNREVCDYDCWNLALHMEARVLLLMGQAARDADFSAPLDLTALPLMEMAGEEANTAADDLQTAPAGLLPDYVIVHQESARDFDGVFDQLRPTGIARDGVHIDAMIVPVPDPERFDLAETAPVLRLVHVSRNVAETPYVPFNGRRMYWNHADRVVNLERAQGYFCSAESRSEHWCNNAFD